MRINNDVANVLGNSKIEGNLLFLPPEQLERSLYVAVNKVLVALGGKWNRKQKAHVFEASPEEAVEQVLQTGEYTSAKKEFQFFETPSELAQGMIARANIQPGETVLEPSAGKGAIAKYLPQPTCVEIYQPHVKALEEMGLRVVECHFLDFDERHDVIIANPPFSKQQDIDHVNHMLDLANRCVVSVMSASVLFRDNRKTVEFRQRIEQLGGTIEPLPDGTFKESGTMVRTCLVHVELK